jgi:hypothetical protein
VQRSSATTRSEARSRRQDNNIFTGVTRLGHVVTPSDQVCHLDPADLRGPVHAILALECASIASGTSSMLSTILH